MAAEASVPDISSSLRSNLGRSGGFQTTTGPGVEAALPGAARPSAGQVRFLSKRTYPRTQSFLLLLLFVGDIAACFGASLASYYLRFHSALHRFGPIPRPDFHLGLYLPLMVAGTIFLIGNLAYLKLYDPRLLLRPLRSSDLILRGTSICFIGFTVISYILKFEPSISRFFTGIAFVTTATTMISWRYGFHQWLLHSRWHERISQRLVFIGWSDEAARLAAAVNGNPSHAFHVCGAIITNGARPDATTGINILSPLDELGAAIQEHLIDTAVLVDLELPRESTLEIAAVCEKHYVEFKIIPSFFQVFLSGLQMQTIAGVPILGVESLPLHSFLNRTAKRLVDIVGAIVGLLISAPIIAVLAVLIKRENPGPVIYRQIRSGRNGLPFYIYKLRSMRLDAENSTGPCWAVANDPRRLRIGAFMREWNLDELPQFWNVLIGDMSLAGPRPERPELIEQFEKTIRNYHPRHEVRPGLSGWAQVNGLRGNTSLSERIRYDLYYIENWSLLLDMQILALTFLRRHNAY